MSQAYWLHGQNRLSTMRKKKLHYSLAITENILNNQFNYFAFYRASRGECIL